jgi:hypothetical protein
MLRINASIARQSSSYDAAFADPVASDADASRQYHVMAYALEVLAWLMLLTGVGLNIFFLSMVMSLL